MASTLHSFVCPILPYSCISVVVMKLLLLILAVAIAQSRPISRPRVLSFGRLQQPHPTPRVSTGSTILRGGGGDDADEKEEDAERYSRQVYTVGARAHGLIRSSTVFLDGPPKSGLLYETAKNLALSGIRRLVLVRSEEDLDVKYHKENWDDLGVAYRRAARSEIEEGGTNGDDGCVLSAEDLLVQYLKRLNPNVSVSLIDRSSLTTFEGGDAARFILLSVDRPYPTQVVLNQLTRQRSWAFIAVETAGVFGRTFCDFGERFEVYDADGETPMVTPLDRVEILEGSTSATVQCVEGERHDVSKGDVIEFQLRSGTGLKQQCKVVDVKTPFQFSVESIDPALDLDKMISQVKEASSFHRVKLSQELQFQSIDIAIEDAKGDGSVFTACDLDKSFDTTRRSASMACFQSLSEFIKKNGDFPCLDDKEEFWQIEGDTWTADPGASSFCSAFLRGCAAKFSPFQAVFGAIGAQEVLKAATGLYFPVRQFLVYDCDEVLGEEQLDKESCAESGLQHILGTACSKELREKEVFVVGAGAIGCELLKNLASMGVGTGQKGKVVLTDMDTIEKSNLSRQLLFRDGDIGRFKSAAAHDAAVRFCPEMKVEAHSSKVGDGESGPFNDNFWSTVDVVLNALDNVDARLYMDGKCVSHKKAMVDAGTMGPKGNVQVVVPHQSESYASSVDPPEPSIPVCTLKNFPYATSHTIQWGRDLFDGVFSRRPEQANSFSETRASCSAKEFAETLIREKGDDSALEAAVEIAEDSLSLKGSVNISLVRKTSLSWAAELGFSLFSNAAKALIEKHPLDSLDDDGQPFWSGTRRAPRELWLSTLERCDSDQDSIDANVIAFIQTAARLRVETLVGSETSDSFFSPEEATAAAIRAQSTSADTLDTNSNQPTAVRIMERLREIKPGEARMLALNFEKDDDANDHVAFVTAASNLRALAYGILPVDAMETRRVAGKIVPAMISTTSFVSGLSCIEFIKLVQESGLKMHRNAFINLALPFFAFTVPLPAETLPGLNGRSYTLWDSIVIKESKKVAAKGGLTLESLLRRIRKAASDNPDEASVSSISYGPYLLYANFLHDDDKNVLETSLWDLLAEAVASDGDDTNSSTFNSGAVELAVVLEDNETGDEFELPPVHVKRWE